MTYTCTCFVLMPFVLDKMQLTNAVVDDLTSSLDNSTEVHGRG